MYDLVLKGGTIVTHDDIFEGDLAIRGEKIATVGESLCFGEDESVKSAKKIFDVSGMIVLPGAVDPHVHMDLPVQGGRTCGDFTTDTSSGRRSDYGQVLESVELDAIAIVHAEARALSAPLVVK